MTGVSKDPFPWILTYLIREDTPLSSHIPDLRGSNHNNERFNWRKPREGLRNRTVFNTHLDVCVHGAGGQVIPKRMEVQAGDIGLVSRERTQD